MSMGIAQHVLRQTETYGYLKQSHNNADAITATLI